MTASPLSRRSLAALPLLVSVPAQADPLDEVRETYRRFVAAQNSRDADAVRGFLLDSRDYLWISDGRAYWGPEAMLARFSGFQRLEIWEARPDWAGMRGVLVAPDVALLHFQLDLALGSRAAPDVFHFLIGALFRRVAPGWRIAALFTTNENRG